MDAQERRRGVARRLEQSRGPVSATALAREFGVSRQIIVGDIALLRAGGIEAQWGSLTEGIRNRDNTGPCPIEYSTAVTDDPEEALMIIRAELNMLGA